ncbi:MAG TPA: MFS transporter [Acidimicrobiales bacterium]
MRGLRQRLAAVAIDATPLRASRDFRFLYAGTAVGQLGSAFTTVAVPYQLYDLTGSTLAIGLFGAVTLVPLLVLNIVGGAIADKVERRRWIVGCQLLGLVGTSGLVLNSTLDQPSLVAIYLCGALDICAFALGAPAERASVIRVVGRAHVPSAMALKAVSSSTAHVAGPAAAGLVLAAAGTTWAYAIDAATFLIAAIVISRMRPLRPEIVGGHPTFGLVLDGLRHLRRQPVLLGSFASDLNAMVLGLPVALFPAVAAIRFPDQPEVLGLLYAAPFAGSLCASLASGWARRVTRHGMVVTVSIVVWGVAMAVFGVVDGVVLSLLTLAIGGAADMVSGISRQAILQLASPPDLVGRMEGVGMAVWTGGPRLGELEAGVVAALTSVQFAIVSGGIGCVVVMLTLARALPGFTRYEAPRDDAPAAAGASIEV